MQQVAKSYHSVGNVVSESSALQTAAKQYLTSEITSTIESNNVTFNEDLISAISVYEEAIRLHCDQNERQLAGKLCLELADILAQKFNKHFEALPYYERAITLFTNIDQSSSLQVILVMFKLAALKVFTCDYTGALSIYTDICNSILSKCLLQPSAGSGRTYSNRGLKNDGGVTNGSGQTYSKPIGIYSRLLVESDVSKLLLLLYLKPTKMKPDHSSTIEVYSWFQALSSQTCNYVPIECMSRDLFILLQSFVMACQSNDVKLLYTLQTELWPCLNDVQNYILNLITDQLLNSSYTDDLLSQ